MMMFTVIGGSIVVGLALMTDAKGTVQLVTTVITVRGIGWLCSKVIGSINKDNADIINFASWSLAGVGIIGILKRSIVAVEPLSASIVKTGDNIKAIGAWFERIVMWVDKMTFWN